MASFLVLFYEADRRLGTPDVNLAAQHQQAWKDWLQKQAEAGSLRGGSALEMTGKIIEKEGALSEGPYFHGNEMVGGFLILEAKDLAAATVLAAGCPVYEAGGFAEVRPFKSRI